MGCKLSNALFPVRFRPLVAKISKFENHENFKKSWKFFKISPKFHKYHDFFKKIHFLPEVQNTTEERIFVQNTWEAVRLKAYDPSCSKM